MCINHQHHLYWQVCALMLAGFLLVSLPVAAAEPGVANSPIAVPNPASDLWRAVRQREAPGAGTTQARGPEAGVLINSSGEDFRNFRRQELIGKSAILIAAFAALILVFYMLHGRIPIEGGRSGRLIRRFADFDRSLHWLVAILFIIQALTGMMLLFGRFVLLPVLGPGAFSVVADASMVSHNYLGPLFLASLVVMLIRFMAKNLPTRHDLKWLLRGGGVIGEGHVSAGFFNAGEKIWYWAVGVLGLTVSISGLILDFPVFAGGRDFMQLVLTVHGIAAVFFITGSLAHIYIGTIGSEGSLESMTTGYVDENWAKAHHDLWYAEAKGRNGTTARENGENMGIPPMPAPAEKT